MTTWPSFASTSNTKQTSSLPGELAIQLEEGRGC